MYSYVIFFILACGVLEFFPFLPFTSLDSCAAITPPKTNHEEQIYGEQLSIRLSMEAAELHFTSVDETEQYVIWAKSHATKKGTVTGMSGERNFIIRSVTFDDQGMYTVMNALNRKTSIYLLKVISKLVTNS